jgi:hypothetical protein
MLEVCLQHPDLYNKDLYNTDNNFYYECIFHYLDTISKNGIIIEDEVGEENKIISNYVSKWPLKQRKKVEEKLKILNKRFRIIKGVSKNTNVTFDCKDDSCDIFHSMFDNEFRAVIVPEKCSNDLYVSSKEIVRINEYTNSDYYNDINKRAHVITANKYTFETFKNNIMIPLFKYAKSIKIVDRMFADHINDTSMELDNYKKGIESLIKIICEANVKSSGLLLEIYSSFTYNENSSLGTELARCKITNINSYIQTLNKTHNINLKCLFKKGFNDMPHDRFILSNQIGIQIGRGIDIVNFNNKLRDNTISILEFNDRNDIEKFVRSLDNI